MMIDMVVFLRIALSILISLRRYSQGADIIYVALVSPEGADHICLTLVYCEASPWCIPSVHTSERGPAGPPDPPYNEHLGGMGEWVNTAVLIL